MPVNDQNVNDQNVNDQNVNDQNINSQRVNGQNENDQNENGVIPQFQPNANSTFASKAIHHMSPVVFREITKFDASTTDPCDWMEEFEKYCLNIKANPMEQLSTYLNQSARNWLSFIKDKDNKLTWQRLKRKFIDEIQYFTSGELERPEDWTMYPGEIPLNYMYRKARALKRKYPDEENFDFFESKIRSGLPLELLELVAPATNWESLEKNIRMAYELLRKKNQYQPASMLAIKTKEKKVKFDEKEEECKVEPTAPECSEVGKLDEVIGKLEQVLVISNNRGNFSNGYKNNNRGGYNQNRQNRYNNNRNNSRNNRGNNRNRYPNRGNRYNNNRNNSYNQNSNYNQGNDGNANSSRNDATNQNANSRNVQSESEVKALVDTGASISIITEKKFRKLKVPVSESYKHTLVFGDGKSESSKGICRLEVKLDNKSKYHEFVVMGDECPFDIILGLDWCREMQISLDFNEHFEVVVKPKVKFQLVDNEKIPAKSCKIVTIQTSAESEGTKLLKSNKRNLIKNGIEMIDGLVEVHESRAEIMVINHQDKDVDLPRDLTVALEEGNENEVYERDEVVKVEEMDINSKLTVEQREKMIDIIVKYQQTFKKMQNGVSNYKHKIILEENTQPIKQRPYRVPAALEPVIEMQIKEMLEDNIIRPSDSPWASPISLVKKKNGQWRMVCDYRRLNAVTRKDAYPLPRIDDLLNKIKNARYFTALDLASGYWQIPMDEDSIDKTAITTHVGLYEYLKLSFGLTNAPGSFAKYMNSIFGDLKNILVYIDDIIIFSKTFEEHCQHLSKALDRLKSNELVCRLKKCSFAYNKIKFLGHTISEEGIQPDERKLDAINKFPTPKDTKAVRSFLGLAGYYRKFIRNFSILAAPLFEVSGITKEFKWTNSQEEAFNKLKTLLQTNPIIKPFDTNRKTVLTTDASGMGLGAVLEQEIDGKMHVIEFASRTLRPNEKKFGVSELECLALVWACGYFKHYLLGLSFTVVTDHHSLCWLTKINNASGRLARYAITLSEFNFKIVYKKGKENCNADCLSRYPVNLVNYICVNDSQGLSNVLDYKIKTVELIEEQKQDLWSRNIIENISIYSNNYVVQDDVLYKVKKTPWGKRKLLCLPLKFRKIILNLCHDTPEAGHLGKNKTIEKVKRRFYWPTIYRDVSQYVITCDTCQKYRERSDKQRGELLPISPADVFHTIGIDIVGPLTKSRRKNKYILVMIDYGTRYAEAVALESITSEEICKALIERIYLKYGAPATIISDRGVQFTSKTTKDLVSKLHSMQLFTTAYHPQANGLVERLNKTLISILRKYTAKVQDNWDDYLPFAIWSYNTAVQSSTGYTPYELVFGKEPNLTVDHLFESLTNANAPYFKMVGQNIEIIREAARQGIRRNQQYQKDRRDHNNQLMLDIKANDLVLVKRNASKMGLSTKLLPKGHGPYRVIQQVSPVNFSLDLGNGKTDVFHISNLYKYNLRQEQDRGTKSFSGKGLVIEGLHLPNEASAVGQMGRPEVFLERERVNDDVAERCCEYYFYPENRSSTGWQNHGRRNSSAYSRNVNANACDNCIHNTHNIVNQNLDTRSVGEVRSRQNTRQDIHSNYSDSIVNTRENLKQNFYQNLNQNNYSNSNSLINDYTQQNLDLSHNIVNSNNEFNSNSNNDLNSNQNSNIENLSDTIIFEPRVGTLENASETGISQREGLGDVQQNLVQQNTGSKYLIDHAVNGPSATYVTKSGRTTRAPEKYSR